MSRAPPIEPTALVRCPRPLWPEVHAALAKAEAPFLTGRSSAREVELLATPTALKLLEPFNLQAEPGAPRDPWSLATLAPADLMVLEP